MRKKIILITCSILALVLIVAAFLYFTPKTTPIDVTLTAQKWDGWGNEVGTVELTIKGQLREYLFKPDVLDIDVTSSDGVLNWDSQLFNPLPGKVTDQSYAYADFNCAGHSKNSPFSILVNFSRNLNRWMFEVRDWNNMDATQPMLGLEAIYIASTEEFDTYESVIEYFARIFPYD